MFIKADRLASERNVPLGLAVLGVPVSEHKHTTV